MSQRIYLDNAATTPVRKEVLDAMLPFLQEQFGNPSSVYSYGREARVAVEKARKKVAELLKVKAANIYFTSGGTESNNTAILTAIRDLGCRHIITSPIEHHAVLHTIEQMAHQFGITTSFVEVDGGGNIDYENLESQLASYKKENVACLVTLMNANNETGAITDIAAVGTLCQLYKAVFHSDAVQTIGHYPIDLSSVHVHFVSASGHKFHAPKGSGILYVKETIAARPLIFGGGQERNFRAGTESVHGIVAFARALELAMETHESDKLHISELKEHLRQLLKQAVENVSFNSTPDSLYTILSVNFPRTPQSAILLTYLDQTGICASGGSACTSGASSHVMQALGKEVDLVTVRFSFNRNNTIEEVEKVVATVADFIGAGQTAMVAEHQC